MNDALKTILAHRSIRSYRDKPIAEEHLEQIIRAVQAAPNWVNLQLVSIIAVKDAERRKRFSSLCGDQKHVAQAPFWRSAPITTGRTLPAGKRGNPWTRSSRISTRR